MRGYGLKMAVLVAWLVITLSTSCYAASRIEFWMQNYDNLPVQTKLMRELAAEFKKETGITVDIEYLNWAEAQNRWTLVANGGAAPDAGDMFWSYTFVDIGGNKYGPMPLDDYVEHLGHERFYESSLADVRYMGHVYGVPWRIDIRPMAYRSDYFAEVGLDRAPETWDELVSFGKKLTKKGHDGRVQRYAIALRSNIDNQQVLPWLWQAGGELMTADGKTAKINSSEMREAMQFVRDLIYKYEIASPTLVDPSYVETDEFKAGKVAMIDHVGAGLKRDLELTAPQLVPVLVGAPPMGHKQRYAYSGAGYFGVLHGTDNVEAAVKWISFLSRDDVQLRLAKELKQYSPSVKASQDPYFMDDPWGANVVNSLKYAHTSQHPSPAYAQLMSKGPGGVMFDLWHDVIYNEKPLDEILEIAQTKAQELMDRVR